MPLYTFYYKSTDEEFQEFMSYNDMKAKCEANPDLDVRPCMPLIGDATRMLKKPPKEFRDRLKQIKKLNPGSNVNDF